METLKIIKEVIKCILSILKAAWDALYATCMGMVSFFLLAGLILYFKADPTPVVLLLQINSWIMNHWTGLFLVLFIYSMYADYNELQPSECICKDKTDKEKAQ